MQKRVSAAELDYVTPAENDLAMTEQAILAAFDAGEDNVTWDIRIIKLDKAAGNAEAFLFSILPAEVDGIMERVRDNYGSGTYRMRAYRSIGKAKTIFKQTDFNVLAAPKPTPAPERASEMAAVLDAIQKQNAATMEMVQRFMATKPETAPADPLASIERVINIVAKILPQPAAVVQQPQGPSPDAAFNLVLKGVELADRLGSERGETTIYDILKETLRNLPALAQLSAAQPPNPSVQRRLPSPPQKPQPGPGDAIVVDPASVKQALAYLLTKAKQNSNPDFYALWITDNWERTTIQWALSQGDLFTVLQSVEPQIAEHKQWFTRLIDALKQLVNNAARDTRAAADAAGQSNSPGSAFADTGREGGSGDDAAHHVGVGEGWEETD